jgi:hypothetical protein
MARWKTTAAAAAAVAIVSLGPSLTSATVVAPAGWRIVALVGPGTRPAEFVQVASSGAGNAWASGFTCRAHNPYACHRERPLLARWNGTSWSAVAVPNARTVRGGVIMPVGTSSPRDTWIFPTYNSNSYPAPPRVAYRWTGSRWHSVAIPAWLPAGPVSVFGPRNVWIFGVPWGKVAGHYDGHRWRKVKMHAEIMGVTAVSPDDIWAFGFRPATPEHKLLFLTMRWDGNSWQTFPLPSLTARPADFLAGLAGTSILASSDPNDLWITVDVLHAPYLLHWDGIGWSVVPIPLPVQMLYGGVAEDGSGGLWLSAVSEAPGPPLYLHRTAQGTWSEQAVPAVAGATTEVNDLLLIPGTTSLWSAGFSVPTTTNGAGVRAAVLKYGH